MATTPATSTNPRVADPHALDRRQAVDHGLRTMGRCLRPGHGQRLAACRSPTRPSWTTRRVAAAAGRGVVGQDVDRGAHAHHVRVPRAASNARKHDMAEILTSEHGKVLSDALGEVNRGLEVVEFACGLAQLTERRVLGERVPGWTATPSASRSASSPASRRSTSRRWCRCGCTRWPSRAATPSS